MSSVRFFTPTSSTALAQERALSRFRGRLAAALSDARLYRYPCCPLRPDARVEVGGVTYAAEWLLLRFDSLSPTTVSAVRVTSLVSGEWVDYDQVIRKVRRSRKTGAATVRYNSPAGNHSSADEVQEALVRLAATHLHPEEVAA